MNSKCTHLPVGLFCSTTPSTVTDSLSLELTEIPSLASGMLGTVTSCGVYTYKIWSFWVKAHGAAAQTHTHTYAQMKTNQNVNYVENLTLTLCVHMQVAWCVICSHLHCLWYNMAMHDHLCNSMLTTCTCYRACVVGVSGVASSCWLCKSLISN